MSQSQQRVQFRQLFASARSAGRIEESVGSIELRIGDGDDSGSVWEAAGLALADLGMGKLGRHFLETAQTLQPLSAEAELVLGECCLRSDETDLAKLLIRNAGSRDGASCVIRLRAAEILGELDCPQCAWMICRRAVNEFPYEARAWFLLSYFMGLVGCPFSRIEIAARQAISLAPDVVNYRVSFASTLLEVGRPQQAYCLVKSFDESQVQKVQCDCCVEKLISIYEVAQDKTRTAICQGQLARLRCESATENAESDWPTGEVA